MNADRQSGLQREEFDAAAEAAAVTRGRTDIGALVTFTGICRGAESGEPIAALTLEHYPGMAEAEIARMSRRRRRAGRSWASPSFIATGGSRRARNIVLVVTASSHREAAFAAAEFLMDYLKTQAPFWKQVEAATGRPGSRPKRRTMPRRPLAEAIRPRGCGIVFHPSVLQMHGERTTP
jgi:molybdopterin synthase catalytic subunit